MVSELTWIGQLSQVTEARAYYFLVLSLQSISKRRLGWLSTEGCIFLSKRNSIPSIFSFRCGKLGLLAEEEFLSEPSIGILSSSKSKFRDLDQDFLLGETPGKSNPSLTRARKTLNTKTDKFWYILYILGLEKDQERKISQFEYQILIYTVSKFQPQIHYILGDMIPPS